MHAIFWSGNVKGRGHFGGLDVNMRIVLKWISKK
jgi:hypothetical protein